MIVLVLLIFGGAGLLAAVTGDGATADDLSVRRWGAARAALARATDWAVEKVS